MPLDADILLGTGVGLLRARAWGSEPLAVDGLVVVGHAKRGPAGNEDVRHRLERHGHAHAGEALVPAHDLDAARPERRRLHQSALETDQVAIVWIDEDGSIDEELALAARLERQ